MNKKELVDLSFPTGGQGAVSAVILAGGLGTRLRSAVPDLPKCMAPVADRPFLGYVIDHLRMQGIQHFVFALGYMAEAIQNFLLDEYPTLQYSIVIEDEPLGTGGAMVLALEKVATGHVLVANGDTLFKIKVPQLFHLHKTSTAECTLSLKPMENFSRYGVVEVDDHRKISSFKEKQFYDNGLINGGVYLLDKAAFLQRSFPHKFSFENDYLEKFCADGNFFGSVQDGYFIDIGIPDDFRKAGVDLKKAELNLAYIDKTWTLFLDRDGVINNEIYKKYVLNWEQFVFSDGVLDSFKILANRFGKIFIVTNQRGVEKGLMTMEDLASIHIKMKEAIEGAGGRVDGIYFTTSMDDNNFYRKPNPGMALQVLNDFPQTDFTKSIMVGNKPSDMRFGRSAGMFTVFVTTTNPEQTYPHKDIDLVYPSLAHFAKAL